MEHWAATELHPSPKPDFDGTMDLKTGMGWPEMLRFWRQDFRIWGLLGTPDGLQMPVATEAPSKVDSEYSSIRPCPSWQERTE